MSVSDDLPPSQVSPIVPFLTRRQLVWSLVLVSGLLLANTLSLGFVNFVASGDSEGELRGILRLAFLSMVLAQMPMAWMWLRVHVARRYIRIVGGWIAAHAITSSVSLANVLFGEREWDSTFFWLMGLGFYFTLVMIGFGISFFTRRLGLGHLWLEERQGSQFAIGDLLSLTLVSALVMGAFTAVRGPDFSLLVSNILFVGLQLAFVCCVGAIFTTLALGSFFGLHRERNLLVLGVLALLGPSLVVGLLQATASTFNPKHFVIANTVVWSFGGTLFLVFPALRESDCPSRSRGLARRNLF